ncbi:MAG: ABC transporter permease [Thermodesulfobacteriota bacterium]
MMLPLSIRSAIEFFIAIFLIYTSVFIAVRIVPTDPARTFLGPLATTSAVEDFRKEFGWDRPLWQSYFSTLSQMLRGNFGVSYYYRLPAAKVMADTIPKTFTRAGVGLLLGVVMGLLLGLASGIFRWNHSPAFFSLFYSIPSFCVLVLLLWGASTTLGWTPLSQPFFYEVLTILAASLYPAGAVGNQVAERLDFESSQPLHVTFLFMLHGSHHQVATVVWRECLIDATSITINSIPVTLGAVTFAEIIFGLTGFGQTFVESSLRSDLSVVVAGSLILSVLFLLIQKSGDAITAMIDPRVLSND